MGFEDTLMTEQIASVTVSVQDLCRDFGDYTAVRDVNLELKRGEVLGLLGPNGAGKTSTLRMLTGNLAPSGGSISICGVDLLDQPRDAKAYIGYLPENNPLYFDMYVREYLQFVAGIHGLDNKSNRVKDLIEMTGLGKEQHKLIGALSKGYKQRVGLAQAMIHDPDILILDEPTSGLDPNQIVEIRHLIKELGKEKTVILSSHILSEVEATCDRILIISKGKIVANGSSMDLRKQAEGNELLAIQLEVNGNADKNPSSALENLSTVMSVESIDGKENYYLVQSKPATSSKRAVFDLCVENKWYLLEMKAQETKLEDVFRELTN